MLRIRSVCPPLVENTVFDPNHIKYQNHTKHTLSRVSAGWESEVQHFVCTLVKKHGHEMGDLNASCDTDEYSSLVCPGFTWSVEIMAEITPFLSSQASEMNALWFNYTTGSVVYHFIF